MKSSRDERCAAYSRNSKKSQGVSQKGKWLKLEPGQAGGSQSGEESVDQDKDIEVQSRENPLRSYNQGSGVIVVQRHHWQLYRKGSPVMVMAGVGEGGKGVKTGSKDTG